LITVAIIAALVGIAVPLYSDFVDKAHFVKASADLDVLKHAINRYESGGHRFGGVTFAPLIGQFLAEVPSDPWGNDYLVDSNLGLVASLGADAFYGGEQGDADILIYYNPTLVPIDCKYSGAVGIPKNGYRLELIMSKSITLIPEAAHIAPDEVLVYNQISDIPLPLSTYGFTLNESETNELDGWIVFDCTNRTVNSNNHVIKAHSIINISNSVVSFTEAPCNNGPFFDSGCYLRLGPEASSLQSGGVRIDRQ